MLATETKGTVGYPGVILAFPFGSGVERERVALAPRLHPTGKESCIPPVQCLLLQHSTMGSPSHSSHSRCPPGRWVLPSPQTDPWVRIHLDSPCSPLRSRGSSLACAEHLQCPACWKGAQGVRAAPTIPIPGFPWEEPVCRAGCPWEGEFHSRDGNGGSSSPQRLQEL